MSIKLTFLSIVLFSLSSCAGGKDSMYSLEQEAPFTFGNMYFQKWVAGVQNGGSGTNVYVEIESYSDEVELKDIYFRNATQSLKAKPNQPDNYIGYFNDQTNRDITMDGDATKEAKNKLPEPFPFKLSQDEAVLSYTHKGELKFLKIGPLEEKPLLAYPSANNGRID